MNIFRLTPAKPSAADNLHSEAHDWLVLLTSGRATVADARALRQWCAQSPEHARAFEDAKVLWHNLQPAAERVQSPRRFGRRAFLGGAIAASAAFLLVRGTIPGGFEGLGADYITEVGQQKRFEPADGVRMELNTQTRINQRAGDDGVQGFELVSGEVEVQTARLPLAMQAGGGWLRASQARFNLRNTDQQVCVTCLDGSVDVNVDGRSLRLQPGEQLTYDSQRVGAVQSVDTAAVMNWRQQVLVFNGATLSQMIDEINRYRPGRIVITGTALQARRVQERIPLPDLDTFIDLVRDVYGARVVHMPGGVVLIG